MTLWTPRAARFAALGATAIAAALAVVRHLDYAVSTMTTSGRDWSHHLPRAARVLAAGFRPERVLSFYDDARISDATMNWPPLGHVVAAAFMAPGRIDPAAAYYASQAIWIAVLVASLYGAGRRLGGSPLAGLAAAFLGGLTVPVLSVARQLNLEFAATASVALALYGFTLSRSLTSTAGSVALGLFCGIAFLVKPVTFAYLVPFLAAAFVLPPEGGIDWKRRGANLMLAALVATLVCGALYVPRVGAVLWVQKTQSRDVATSWRENLAVFTRYMAVEMLSPAAWALTLAALAASLARRDRLVAGLLLAAGTTFAYLLTLYYDPTNSAFYLPYAILAALVVARAFRLVPRWARAAVTAVACAVVLAPPAEPRAPERPGLLTRALYSRDSRTSRPLVGLPLPGGGDAGLWSLRPVFAGRYAAYGPEDLGVLVQDYDLSVDVQAAASMARSLDLGQWNAPVSIANCLYVVGDPRRERWRLSCALGRSLIVAAWPVEPGAPREAEPEAMRVVLERVRRAHRLDLVLDPPPDPRGGNPRASRFAFFVRNDEGPHP